MTIGQVAKAGGVPASTIRFYETVGILPPPRRKNGIREYDGATIEQLRVLRFFRETGVTIANLVSMTSGEPRSRAQNRHEVVLRRISELDNVIDEARAMKRRLRSLLDCECNGDKRKCVIFR